ncbi:hypothetical protein D3C78_1865410 [compost metagenome]
MDMLRGAMHEEGIAMVPDDFVMEADHIFSHIHWHLRVYRCASKLPDNTSLPESYRYIEEKDMDELAFPNVFIRTLRAYFKEILIS